MTRKHLLAALLVLPLAAASSAALAGPKITDKSYWPESRTTERATPDAYSAYGQAIPYGGAAQVRTQEYGGQRSCTYQGGPKSPFWTCR